MSKVKFKRFLYHTLFIVGTWYVLLALRRIYIYRDLKDTHPKSILVLSKCSLGKEFLRSVRAIMASASSLASIPERAPMSALGMSAASNPRRNERRKRFMELNHYIRNNSRTFMTSQDIQPFDNAIGLGFVPVASGTCWRALDGKLYTVPVVIRRKSQKTSKLVWALFPRCQSWYSIWCPTRTFCASAHNRLAPLFRASCFVNLHVFYFSKTLNFQSYHITIRRRKHLNYYRRIEL